MKTTIRTFIAAVIFSVFSVAHATTDWSTQDYDLYSGDFDGDGKVDVLYIAKDPSKPSGIAKSDGNGPNIPWQSWPGNYLNIQWSGSTYTAIVADFNGDGKADVLLQRNTPGDSYLIFADAQGKLTAISQTIASGAFGGFTADQHKIIAGKFNADSKADLFLQATSPSMTNEVVLADANSQFTSGPAQSWTDSGAPGGFKWSTKNAIVYAGDFNGDGLTDLLVQARPNIVMVDYDIPIPVPTYPPNMNGIVFAQASSTIFSSSSMQAWSRNAFGVDWSPLSATVVVGDFNGDGRADVVLQAKYSSKTSYLLTANASGSIFPSAGTAISSNVALSSDSARLVVGNFDGTGGVGIYIQALSPSGTNYVTNGVSSTVTASAHDPSQATGTVPASAVGRTVGSFAVTASGAATYSIPIVVPPGVLGMQPSIAIAYQSGGGNGFLGVGWGISGLSQITRCNKTIAQDGVSDGVKLTTGDTGDVFCLDGNKLRKTNTGAYGADLTTYQTELETFSRVTSRSSAGNGPAYFIVEGKNGLKYEYGNTTDSRIEVLGTSTPRVWALNKVSDRSGNYMTLTYVKDGSPNGSFRPSQINYTFNDGASLTGAYRVVFVWDPRPDPITGYVAGGLVNETQRLNRIETQYNDPTVGSWRLVRKYQLSYSTNNSTKRSRLNAVQECDRSGYCLSPTTIAWQEGAVGWAASDTTTSSSSSSAAMESSIAVDVDGDGREDLVYPQGNQWWYMLATASGSFGTPVNTGVDATNSKALPIDYFGEGRVGLLISPSGYSTRQILRWNGSTLALTNTNISAALTETGFVADFTGDGRPDFLYAGSGGIYVQANSGVTSGTAQFAAAQNFYPVAAGASYTGFIGSAADPATKVIDFNGDGRADFLFQTTSGGCGLGECTYFTTWTVLISTGSAFTQAQSWSCTAYGPSCNLVAIAADFNGDGLTDVVSQIVLSDGVTYAWQIMYGSGAGLSAATTLSLPGDFLGAAIPVDFDGDGRSDLMYVPYGGSYWYVLRFNGNGFDPPVATPIPSSSADNTLRLIDIDGDGQKDIGYKNTQFRVRAHNGAVPDLVRSITDGFGNSVALTYAPLTDGSVYTKGTGATFPEIDIQAPMYVVKQYTSNTGIAPMGQTDGTYTVTESYTGARIHAQGRGFEGFASHTETDSRTQIANYSTFRQDFPFTGMTTYSKATTQNGTGVAVSELTNTLTEISTTSTPVALANPPPSGTLYADRHLPYLQTSNQLAREVGGTANNQAIKRVVSSVGAIDGYGNPTTATATTTDQTDTSKVYATQTINTVTNDAANWCLGVVTQQQVTSSVPNAAALYNNATPTRTLKFDPDTDPTKCRIYKQTIEPNTATQVVTTFLFDTLGHTKQTTISATGVADRIAKVDYGSQGVFPVQFTNAVNEISYKTYDYALGQILTATDPNGVQVFWQYDGFGRKKQENAPDGTATTWTLYSCNVGNAYCGDNLLRYQVVRQQLDGTASHNVVRTDIEMFDAFARSLYTQSQSLSGAYTVVKSIYEKRGLLAQRSVPYFTGLAPSYTSYTYDTLGRLSQIQRQVSDSDTSTETTQYTYTGLAQSVTDPLSHTTTQTQNAIGQVVSTTDALGNVTAYQYDALGNLAATTDPQGNVVSSAFNVRGFKVASSDPDMGSWTYDYYATGELKTQTDAKGQVISFTYDNISRPLTRIEPEGTTGFVYGSSAAAHNIGKLQSVSAPGGYAEAFTYDALGRPQTTSYTEDVPTTPYQIDYSYNAQGTLDTLTYPVSTSGYRLKLQYSYTNGQVSQITDYNNSATQFWKLNATNASNQPIDESLANGVRVVSGFDGITGLVNYRQSGNSGSTSNLQSLSYQWDKVGNLTQRQDVLQNLTENFYYDKTDGTFNLYRLDRSTLKVGSGTANQNFTASYSPIGNITAKDGASYVYTGAQTGCTYNFPQAQPHAVRAIGSSVYCYDANGNMTSRAGTAITWTSYNLPSQIGSGANYSQFSYGAYRNRWKQIANYNNALETTVYIGGLVEKVTRNGVTEYKHYIAGGSSTAIYTRRSDGTTSNYYVASDHLGSADVVTDGSGAAIVRESFAAFGARRGSNWSGTPSTADQNQFAATTRHGYTGHEELDNLNLIHMNGRVYDPQIGRFLSADPYIQAPMNLQSLNRYSYVMNGPMSATDPSGYFSLGRLLNPFSRRNPIGLQSSFGRIAGAALFGDLPYLDYQVHQADRNALRNNPWMQPIAQLVAGIVDAYIGAPVFSPLLAADIRKMNGGSSWDALRSFAVSVNTYYIFEGIGDVTSSIGNGYEAAAFNVAAHAAAGCGLAAADGGSCGAGAVSAGFGAAYSNATTGIESLNSGVGGLVGAAVSGGIGSELAGGDFWEGAKMAGMGYLFNQAAHRYQLGPTRMCWTDQSGCTLDNALAAADSVSVPFVQNPAEGRMEIGPFGDPIFHYVDHEGYQIYNIALDGHTFFPGQVLHSLSTDTGWSFSWGRGFYTRQGIYLTTVGTGTGRYPSFNNAVGIGLFKGTHIMAPIKMRQYLDGP